MRWIPKELRTRVAVAVLVAGIAAVGVLIGRGGGARSPAPVRGGQHMFIDCSGPIGGDGSRSRPWNRLGQANRALLGPGSWLLLRRGSVCPGFLAPRGSGAARDPVVIGAYGRGALPRIQTNGAAPDSLRLSDDSNVIVQDLELTNHGDYRRILRGVHVVAGRAGTVHDITIRRLYVHDIRGADVKGPDGTGGIQVDGASSNVVIENNAIADVNRSGIWVSGTGRDPRPPAGQPWPSASTGVVIEANIVRSVGGDGIVPTATVGAVVADNVVCCGNLRGRAGRQYDAGIWTFDANNTVIERNVVYDMANGHADGTGFDIDYNQDGTVVQSNYGYRNAGGFILLCAVGDPTRRALVTFNLSVDEYTLSEAVCAADPPRTGNLSGLQIYNNTFLTGSSLVWHQDSSAIPTLPVAGRLAFFNNIIVASRPQRQAFPCGHECSHNLFWRLPPSGTGAIEADPRFSGGTPRGGRAGLGAPFRLRRSSPARAAGLPLPPGAGPDYFGMPIPRPPSVGFDQIH